MNWIKLHIIVPALFLTSIASTYKSKECPINENSTISSCIFSFSEIESGIRDMNKHISNLNLTILASSYQGTANISSVASPVFNELKELLISVEVNSSGLCNASTFDNTSDESPFPESMTKNASRCLDDKDVSAAINAMVSSSPNLEVLKIKQTSRLFLYYQSPTVKLNNLASIHINHFKIRFDREEIFNSMGNLQMIDLDYTWMKRIEENTFKGCCKSIFYLSLQNNEISDVSYPRKLVGLESLHVLNLAYNYLKAIPNDTFIKHLKRLVSLNLRGNEIETIGAFAFDGMRNLKELDLSLNKLAEVPKLSSLSKAPFRITSLYIAHNQLEHFDVASLKQLAALNELDLSNNYLHHFRLADVENMKNLRILALSNNYISYLVSEESPKPSESKLTQLLLDGNYFVSLRKVSQWLRRNLATLKVLDLSRNPWEDCEVFESWWESHENLFSYNSSMCDQEVDEMARRFVYFLWPSYHNDTILLHLLNPTKFECYENASHSFCEDYENVTSSSSLAGHAAGLSIRASPPAATPAYKAPTKKSSSSFSFSERYSKVTIKSTDFEKPSTQLDSVNISPDLTSATKSANNFVIHKNFSGFSFSRSYEWVTSSPTTELVKTDSDIYNLIKENEKVFNFSKRYEHTTPIRTTERGPTAESSAGIFSPLVTKQRETVSSSGRVVVSTQDNRRLTTVDDGKKLSTTKTESLFFSTRGTDQPYSTTAKTSPLPLSTATTNPSFFSTIATSYPSSFSITRTKQSSFSSVNSDILSLSTTKTRASTLLTGKTDFSSPSRRHTFSEFLTTTSSRVFFQLPNKSQSYSKIFTVRTHKKFTQLETTLSGTTTVEKSEVVAGKQDFTSTKSTKQPSSLSRSTTTGSVSSSPVSDFPKQFPNILHSSKVDMTTSSNYLAEESAQSSGFSFCLVPGFCDKTLIYGIVSFVSVVVLIIVLCLIFIIRKFAKSKKVDFHNSKMAKMKADKKSKEVKVCKMKIKDKSYV